MFRCRLALLLALLCALTSQPAQAFIDPPYITPTAPVAGEMISVNIRYGVCDLIFDIFERTQDGNAIRIVLSGVHYDDPFMCNLGDGVTGVYPVAAYPPGSYTLQVDFFYYSTTGIPETVTLGIVPFTVAAAPVAAVPAPVNGHIALGFLMFVLLALSTRRLRTRGSTWLIVAVMSMPFQIRAQDAPNPPVIELLLTTAPGAPTPEQLVSYFDRLPRGGPLPLQALSVGNPSSVELLAVGASDSTTGEFPQPNCNVVGV